MTSPLKIMDTSDPSQPTVLMEYPNPNSNASENYYGIGRVISDNLVHVYVSKYDTPAVDDYIELQIVDFTTAPNYTVLGRYSVGDPDRRIFSNALEGTPTHAFLGWSDGAVDIVDTSDPSNPTLISTYVSTGTLISLRIADNLLFAGYEGKLEIIDVSDPYNPTLLSLTPISATICNITVADGWAYLSTEFRWWSPSYAGLFIYNVSDPASPVFYQRYPISTYNVQVIGGLA